MKLRSSAIYARDDPNFQPATNSRFVNMQFLELTHKVEDKEEQSHVREDVIL